MGDIGLGFGRKNRSGKQCLECLAVSKDTCGNIKENKAIVAVCDTRSNAKDRYMKLVRAERALPHLRLAIDMTVSTFSTAGKRACW